MKNILLLLLLFGSTTAALHAQTICANRCLNFDGKDDYVQLAKSPVKGNVNFTIEGWFRSLDNDGLTACPGGNFERIIGCGGGGSRLEIGECAGKFSIYSAPGGYLSSGVTTGDGKWHYFAMTKEGDAFKVFLDGDLVLIFNLPAGSAFSLENTFRIGRWPGGGGLTESWQGDIDELRVWDSALPEEALQANMTCKLTGQEAGLIAYYNFDQGAPDGNNSTVKTLTDLSASKNNGTMTGFALTGAGSNWVCSGTPQAVFCGEPTQIAPILIAPAESEVVSTSTKRKVRFQWAQPYTQGQSVQYKVEVFKNGTDGAYVTLIPVFSQSISNQFSTEVAVLELRPELNKLEQYTWKVTALYKRDSVDCSKGCISNQGGFFLLTDEYDVNVRVVGSAVCAQPAYTSTGKARYNVSVTLTNLSLGTSTGVPLNFWKKPPFLTPSLPAQILLYAAGTNVLGNISNLLPATLPSTLAYNVPLPISFTVEVPPSATVLDFQAYFHSQANDVAGNPLVSYTTVNPKIPLPPCVCRDACKEMSIQIGGSATPIKVPHPSPDYDVLGINQTITVAGGTRPITRIEAEIIYFDHKLQSSPALCCKVVCNTKPSRHAEFIGTSTVLGGAGWQNGGQPVDFVDWLPGPGDFEASTVNWYSLTSSGTTLLGTNLHLDIAVPNFSSSITQPNNCDCHSICIRYTFFDKDCKICELVRSFSTCGPAAYFCR